MLATAFLVGFFAAHAVWSIADGETLVPIYAYVDSAGKRHMDRLMAESLDVSVKEGRKRLAENPDHAQCAVLIFDGYVPVENVKTDALILKARDARGEGLEFAH